jgi:hypothetical protein
VGLAEDIVMGSSIRGAGLVALALFGAAAGTRQDSPALARVGVERATLRALPKDEGSPALAELLPGTALRVAERRDGYARVLVEGWLPEAALAAVPGAPAPKEPAQKPPAPPPPPPEPVRDLVLAHHVDVQAEVRVREDARELQVSLELRTLRGQPVLVEGARHPGKVRIFEQRRVAGGRARGPELLEREVLFEGGRASLVLPLADLGASPPKLILVSASAELSPQRAVHGAATDVSLAAR